MRRYPKASVLVLVRSPQLISHKWCERFSSGRMSCCLSLALRLFVFASFSYIGFIKAAAFNQSSIYAGTFNRTTS